MVTGLMHQLAQCYLQTAYCPLYLLTTCFQYTLGYAENMLLAGTRDNNLSVGSIVRVGAWGQSPSPLIWCHHMCHTVVQNSFGRQVVSCRWTAALEQAACFTAVIWQSLPIRKTVEKVFVCQGLACGTYWLLLLSTRYKYSFLLTYLLTYLLCSNLIFYVVTLCCGCSLCLLSASKWWYIK